MRETCQAMRNGLSLFYNHGRYLEGACAAKDCSRVPVFWLPARLHPRYDLQTTESWVRCTCVLKACATQVLCQRTHRIDASPQITLRGNNVTLYEPMTNSSDAVPPDSKPSYIVFVGKMTKTVMLDELFGGSRHTGLLLVHKAIYLRSSPKLRADTPLVIIDSGVPSWQTPLLCTSRPVTRETSWQLITDRSRFTTLMCASVFSVFSSVICYFVQDLGGLAATAARLAEQITMELPTISRTQARPCVLLVLPASPDTIDKDIVARKALQLIVQVFKQTGQRDNSATAQRQVHAHFTGLEVITLQSDESNAAQAEALRRRLLAMSTVLMRERESAHALFSFRYFLDLSRKLLGFVCSNLGDLPKTFSLVRALRPCGFLTDLLEHCLTDFLMQIPSQAWLWHLVAPIVASALMLASYLPGAYSKYRLPKIPKDVY